jgi:hypothetical protein
MDTMATLAWSAMLASVPVLLLLDAALLAPNMKTTLGLIKCPEKDTFQKIP